MKQKPYVVGAIFARGGSKGVPRKNIRPLAGKPLIAHAIERAQASRLIDRLVVSTDDEEIARVAREYGAETPFLRPAELAADDSPELLAWRHLIQTLAAEPGAPEMAVMCSVPCTAPLGRPETVDACISTLLASDAEVVITVREAARNPYFGMVNLDEQGYARKFLTLETPLFRRQDAPKVYDIVPVAYAVRPAYVLEHTTLFEGKVKAVVIPPEETVDIDTELDFEFAEFLLGRRGNT